VLSKSPHTHLVGPCYREEGSRQTLGHDGEADPGADLVGVVGARAQVEQACQWVRVGHWDLSLFRSSRPQVSEKQVAGKVSKLTEKEESEACVHLS